MHNIFKFIKKHGPLFGIICIAFLIRMINIHKPEGLWFDEAVSYLSSQQEFPFGIIKFCFTEDLQPPIYSILLGFWTNLFGTADTTLRMMSVISGVLIVPVVYRTASLLTTRRAGLIAASLACVNSLLIVYSQEVRVYSLATLFAAISIMFLVAIFKNSENIKNYIGYTVANLLLVYTSSFGLAFIGLQAIVYLIYLYLHKKPLKKYLVAQMATLTMSLPFLFIVFNYTSTFTKNIVPQFDWAQFKPEVILYILQDWFTPILINIFNYSLGYLHQLLHSGKYIFIGLFILFPLIVGMTGFARSLKTPGASFLAIIAASFFSFQIVMTLLGQMALLSRYTIISLPIIIVLVATGLSNFKKPKHLKIAHNLFIGYIVVSLWFICTFKGSAPKISRPEPLNAPFELLTKYNFSNNDLIFMPFGGRYCNKYNLENIRVLDFDLLSTYHAGKREYLQRIFDKQFIDTLTITNSKQLLRGYVGSSQPPAIFTNYMKDQVFTKLKQGDKLGIVVSKNINLYNKGKLRFISSNESLYGQQSLLFMLSSKLTVDFVQTSDRYLSFIGSSGSKAWNIYVFEKK